MKPLAGNSRLNRPDRTTRQRPRTRITIQYRQTYRFTRAAKNLALKKPLEISVNRQCPERLNIMSRIFSLFRFILFFTEVFFRRQSRFVCQSLALRIRSGSILTVCFYFFHKYLPVYPMPMHSKQMFTAFFKTTAPSPTSSPETISAIDAIKTATVITPFVFFIGVIVAKKLCFVNTCRLSVYFSRSRMFSFSPSTNTRSPV